VNFASDSPGISDIEPRTFFHRLEPLSALRAQTTGVLAPGSTEGTPPASGASKYANRILIHPGSGSPKKNWPTANWREVIFRLGVPTSLILGEAEQKNWPDASASSANHRGDSETLDLINAPLEDLVQALSSCRLFLGHDSGISHLAAATGAKCVLLFGPTEPACWAPPAPNVRVLQNHSDLASLSIEAVQSAVQAALSDQR
jgi:heptosyltransferase-3